jgi:hypothetical protein
MVQSREVEYVNRFDGGLNLTQQTQSLAENESPDCVNVDFGQRGGFVLRGGFQTKETDNLLNGARFTQGSFASTDEVYVQSAAGDLLEWDGGTLSDTTHNLTDVDVRVRSASFNGYEYFANGYASSTLVMSSWDGTTFRSPIPNVFNDDYLAPDAQGAGNVPQAKFVAEHLGYLWVANTVESSVAYPNRVRFSHVQAPENFATSDWFLVGDDDPITALTPFMDRLLIFKLNSVWQLLGYDSDTWVLERITNASGICTCGASAVNSGVAYWFSTDGQLLAFNGERVTVLSEPLRWWSDVGRIAHGGAHRLMWADGRLWLSLEAGSGYGVSRWLFIWDPSVKAFTRYDREPKDLLWWALSGEDGSPLFLENSDNNLFRYDRGYVVDTDADGTVRIDGYYRTGWLTAGETATRKRWKRPNVTAAATGQATIVVEAFYDFDDLTPMRQTEFTVDVPVEASLWGSMDWGDDWYVAAEEYYAFARLSASGTARSLSYKFSSPDNVGRWWVDSLAIPYRRKQIK